MVSFQRAIFTKTAVFKNLTALQNDTEKFKMKIKINVKELIRWSLYCPVSGQTRLILIWQNFYYHLLSVQCSNYVLRYLGFKQFYWTLYPVLWAMYYDILKTFQINWKRFFFFKLKALRLLFLTFFIP